MLNVHSAGKEPYQSAPPLKPMSLREKLQLILLVFIDFVKVTIFAVIELIKFSTSTNNRRKRIAGQNALITGGANGIGKEIALELARCGCNIVIADIDDAASEKTLALLQEFDVESLACSTDVSNSEEVENLKCTIDESLGPVHILVNNAGLLPALSLREGCFFDIERIVDVNINANFWTVRTFLQDMINRKQGHIVQIASMASLHPLPGGIVYTATKYAVTGFMLALEEELRQEGLGNCIDFTTVHPYFVSTRRDLMNSINLRFPAITAERTAKEVVRGIIHRKRRVVIPQYDAIFTGVLLSLPYTLQCLVRDYILREPESRVIKDPLCFS